MDMETLKNFLLIAQESNITQAARSIHITQPTLSRQLKAKESCSGSGRRNCWNCIEKPGPKSRLPRRLPGIFTWVPGKPMSSGSSPRWR